MSDDPTVVETAEGGGGVKQWRLLRRPLGLYLYEEMTLEHEVYLLDEEGNEGAVVADAYWTPTHVSGLFDSGEAARQDAVATLPWLRAALATGLTNGSSPPQYATSTARRCSRSGESAAVQLPK